MAISSALPTTQSILQTAQTNSIDAAEKKSLTTKQAFQDFVAGTFYKMMLKSLRSTQGEIQYLGGGKAEEVFRNQLDQQIAEDLARKHGSQFSDPLYPSFKAYLDKAEREKTQGLHLDQIT